MSENPDHIGAWADRLLDLIAEIKAAGLEVRIEDGELWVYDRLLKQWRFIL